MNCKFLLILLGLSINLLFSQTKDSEILEKFLSEQKDLSFTKISTQKDLLFYELKIKQPVSWNNPEKGFFNQTVILTHKGLDNPMVMETQGYQLYPRRNEIEIILDANNLNIEHRYFGQSIPDSIQFDWEELNLYNVAQDLHHINTIFKKIYSKGKWVSTGISKGGQTAIYYKYFYPKDVEVAIPYVAPINYTLEDSRIYTFLESVGTEECRNKIKDFQTFLFKNEEEALKYIKVYSDVRGLTYNYLGSIDKAYEYTVLEYSFSFWQWGCPCNEIPKNPTISEAVDYLLKISTIDFFSDSDIDSFASHYYQAATEMGYYGYNISDFTPYITQFNENPSAVFTPKSAGDIKYNPELNRGLKKWLKNQANNIIYIYGEIDTWSATQVIPSSKTNSISLIIPKANHFSARIVNMNDEMKKEISNTLYEWLTIKPDFSLL